MAQIAAKAVHQSPQHFLQQAWVAHYRRQALGHDEFQLQLTALQLPFPGGAQLGQQGCQVGAGQWPVARGAPLQFGRMENEAEAVDLFAAFGIDLAQAFLHHWR